MSLKPLDSSNCTLAGLRKVVRSVSKIYDSALAAVDLKSTQFSLLVTINKCDGMPLGQLSKVLVMERTTLSRNIKPLESKGLVKVHVDKDKRFRIISITADGKAKLIAAEPIWEQAQSIIFNELKQDRWEALMGELSFLTDVAKKH